MPTPLLRPGFLLAAVAVALGCASPAPPTVLPAGLRSPYTGYASATYGDARRWLCRPDLPNDPCRSADLTATEIHPDGSRTIVKHVAAVDPPVDCFYVYPTTDLGLFAGNHTDFGDVDRIVSTTVAQAARFGEVCKLYVPLYRQVTIGTYLLGVGGREPFLRTAFSDVEDAFLHYLGTYNHGRKVVLIGHSQGAEMVLRVLQKRFDQDAALRERLLLAIAVGGQVEVPRGRTTGGSLATIPMCTRPDEPGCVIAFRSYRAHDEETPGWGKPKAGNEVACVNPASVGGRDRQWFSRTYLPVDRRLRGLEGVTTPFVVVRDLYAGECAEAPGGFRYLGVSEVRAQGDVRVGPVDLESWLLNTGFGLHVLDLQFPQGDLIDLVARRAGTLPR